MSSTGWPAWRSARPRSPRRGPGRRPGQRSASGSRRPWHGSGGSCMPSSTRNRRGRPVARRCHPDLGQNDARHRGHRSSPSVRARARSRPPLDPIPQPRGDTDVGPDAGPSPQRRRRAGGSYRRVGPGGAPWRQPSADLCAMASQALADLSSRIEKPREGLQRLSVTLFSEIGRFNLRG